MKILLAVILVFSLADMACAQGDVIDIRVIKDHGIDITPDTPYLIHAHKYQFTITGTLAGDEILVSIDKGKASVKDTILYLIPRYTKGDRHTEPDTAIVTVRLRDRHQAEKGSFKKRYLVYSPLNKPQKRGREGRFLYWGDWAMGTYISKGIGTDTPAYRSLLLDNLDKGFTLSEIGAPDSTRFKFSSLTLTALIHYHKYYTHGNRLSPEMINAVRDEKDGCVFEIQLFKKNEAWGIRMTFDTRPFDAQEKQNGRKPKEQN